MQIYYKTLIDKSNEKIRQRYTPSTMSMLNRVNEGLENLNKMTRIEGANDHERRKKMPKAAKSLRGL